MQWSKKKDYPQQNGGICWELKDRWIEIKWLPASFSSIIICYLLFLSFFLFLQTLCHFESFPFCKKFTNRTMEYNNLHSQVYKPLDFKSKFSTGKSFPLQSWWMVNGEWCFLYSWMFRLTTWCREATGSGSTDIIMIITSNYGSYYQHSHSDDGYLWSICCFFSFLPSFRPFFLFCPFSGRTIITK